MFHHVPSCSIHRSLTFWQFLPICCRPRTGHFEEVGSNQAFTEGSHAVFPYEMKKYNYYGYDVSAGFIEGWCDFVSWFWRCIFFLFKFFRIFSTWCPGIDFFHCGIHMQMLAEVSEHEPELLPENKRFQRFIRIYWQIKICYAKDAPVPRDEEELQLYLWSTVFGLPVCLRWNDFKFCWNEFHL